MVLNFDLIKYLLIILKIFIESFNFHFDVMIEIHFSSFIEFSTILGDQHYPYSQV
jgi:hypothetical protein